MPLQQHNQLGPYQQVKVEHQRLVQQRHQLHLQQQQKLHLNQQQQFQVKNDPNNLTETQKRRARLRQYPKHIRMLLSKEHGSRKQRQLTLQQQLRSNIENNAKKELMQNYAKDHRQSVLLVQQLNQQLMKLLHFERVRCKLLQQKIAKNQALQQQYPPSGQAQAVRVVRPGVAYPRQSQPSHTVTSNSLRQEFITNPPHRGQQVLIKHPSTAGPSIVNQHSKNVLVHPYSRPFTPMVQASQSNQTATVVSNQVVQLKLDSTDVTSVLPDQASQTELQLQTNVSNQTSEPTTHFVQPIADLANQTSLTTNQTVLQDQPSQINHGAELSETQNQVVVTEQITNVQTESQPSATEQADQMSGQEVSAVEGSENIFNLDDFPDLLGDDLELD